jgi:hypothetical protein
VASDEITIGLDGEPTATITLGTVDDFAWAGGGLAAIEVGEPGFHTIQIWMGDDGAIADRILVTHDPTYTPQGDGPDESGHEPPRAEEEDPLPESAGCGCRAATASHSLLLGMCAIVQSSARDLQYGHSS